MSAPPRMLAGGGSRYLSPTDVVEVGPKGAACTGTVAFSGGMVPARFRCDSNYS
jgi:hypothetical protein